MARPSQTKQYLFANVPRGKPTTSGPSPTFKLVTQPLPDLKPGQLLLRTLYLSNDPAQRTWISPIAEPDRFYAQPVPLNTPMRAQAVCEVVESGDSRHRKGSLVVALPGWTEFSVLPARECQPAPPLPGGLSETHYLGALGATGMTAYYGLVEIARAKPTDVVVVSGAAGATGGMVVQIARHLLGCRRIIGIAGGETKCDYVKQLGADECVDYKSPTFRKDLYKVTGRKVNVFFDNVGGSVFNLVLACMARDSRIAVCGAISSYNDEDIKPFRNWHEIIAQRIEVKGFVIFDAWHKRAEIMQALRRALSDGKLKIGDEHETVVSSTFEDIPSTWMKLFSGTNTGKLVTRLIGNGKDIDAKARL